MGYYLFSKFSIFIFNFLDNNGRSLIVIKLENLPITGARTGKRTQALERANYRCAH